MAIQKRIFPLLVSTGFLILMACGGGDAGSGSGPGPGPGPNGNNTAPVANAGDDDIVTEGSTVILDGRASSDEDGDTLTYTWEQTAGPNVTLADADTATSSFTAPAVEAATVLTFTLTVNDGSDNATDTIDITVTNLNHAPVADAGGDVTATEGDTVTLEGNDSSDEDGDTLTYTWVQTAGPNVTLANADSVIPSFTAPDVAAASVLKFVVTVSDGSMNSTDEVTVTVEPILLDVAVSETKTLTFTWNGSAEAGHYRLLENPDGASGFEVLIENIDAAEESVNIDVPVHLFDWMNAEYILEACLDADCTNAVLSNTKATDELVALSAIGYVKASNTGEDNEFGVAIAISGDGNTLAVGAHREESDATGINGDETNSGASASGAVYIYVRDVATGSWAKQAYIKASNAQQGDEFGFSVALSTDGNTLAVGAPNEDSAAASINGTETETCGGAMPINCAPASGAAYVFFRTGATWQQQAYVKPLNSGIGDLFGDKVTLSGDGNTLAVGAFQEDGGGDLVDPAVDDAASSAGAVYLFTRIGTAWSQAAYVKASNSDANDLFGNSIALSRDGRTLAIGAIGEASNASSVNGDETDNSRNLSGAVYVFACTTLDGVCDTGAEWSKQVYLKASNSSSVDIFGGSVALSADGDLLAVGATGEDSDETGVDATGNNDFSSNSGAVYLFSRTGTEWAQEKIFKASNTGALDNFGYAVALSADGNMLGVAAKGEKSTATGINGNESIDATLDTGAYYFFTIEDGAWNQQAYIKASNTGGGDKFGIGSALSDDGRTLAIGATFEDSDATGVNGNQTSNDVTDSGAVYIY